MITSSLSKESKYLMALAATCLAFSTAALAAEGHFKRTLHVTGPVQLSVQTGAGTIAVRTGGDSVVEVEGTIRAWNGLLSNGDAEKRVRYLASHPPVEQHGNVIEIGKITESSMRHNISISYELVVPANTQLSSKTGSGDQTVDGISGPLEAETGSGDIKGSNIGGNVQAKTGSGEIVMENVKEGVRASTGSGDIRATGVGGSVRASTGSGSVTVQQTGAGDTRVNTGSGNIVLKNTQGLVHAKTASGSITAEGGGKSPWYLESVSGNVSVRVPPNVCLDLHAHTVSGSKSTNRPLTLQGTISKREITGKAGKIVVAKSPPGKKNSWRMDSGNIHIDWVA
ncbi:MAG: DUF4097 family beta strand repeat-containing protein [Acidobacteriota bacterium]